MANKKDHQQNEFLNFDFDVNSEVARFVIDNLTHDILSLILGALDRIEIDDNKGSTVVFGGTDGNSIGTLSTTDTNVPNTADKVISGYDIEIIDNDGNDILISFDGGTTYKTIEMVKRNFRSADLKGELTQLKLKTTSSTIADSKFEITLNFEDF